MTLLRVIGCSLFFIISDTSFSIEAIPLPPSLDSSSNKLDSGALENSLTPPPPLPELEDDSRNIPEPEVHIIQKEGTVIEEYRIHGHLRYVKITPINGPAYYMVDTNGDGLLETRENDLDNPPNNRWILFGW